jgi:hypothetical protein
VTVYENPATIPPYPNFGLNNTNTGLKLRALDAPKKSQFYKVIEMPKI